MLGGVNMLEAQNDIKKQKKAEENKTEKQLGVSSSNWGGDLYPPRGGVTNISLTQGYF